MANLLHKASIITTPTAYGVGVLNSIKPAYALGENLVVNGTFDTDSDWVKGVGWTISGGKANKTGSVSDSLYQSGTFTQNKRYKLSFSLTNTTQGNLIGQLFGGGGSDEFFNRTSIANGNYTFEIKASINRTTFGFYASGSFNGSIDNVSVVEVTDADFDFTRTSSATRVNPDYLLETVSINGSELVQNGNFSELGSELVTNGNFETDSDWTKQTGWTISGGTANYDFLTNSKYLRQTLLNGGFVSGETYKINFEITEGTAYMNIKSNAETLESTALYSIGSYSIYVTASANGSDLLIYGLNTQGTAFSIDNVSVKQVDPNDNWTIINGTVTDKYNASMTAYQSGIRITPFSYTGTFKVVFDLVITSGNCKFDGGGGNDEIYTTSGTKEKIITNPTKFEFNAFNLGWVGSLDNVSVIELQQNGVPRLDYTNGVAQILVENASTNLITYSQDFSQSAWLKTNLTLSSNSIISPSGVLNASKLIPDTTLGQHKIDITKTVTNGSNVSLSAFVKKGEYNFCCLYEVNSTKGRFFDLSNGTQGGVFGNAPTTSNIEDYGNDWYKISITTTVPSTSARYILYVCDTIFNTSFAGNGTNGIYAWGTQLEQGSYPTSYIPTDGLSVTRAAETLNNAGNSDLINSTEGVLYAEIAALSDDLTFRTITLSDGTTSNNVGFGYRNNSNVIYTFLQGVINSSSAVTVSNITDFNKVAIKYKSGDYAMWINGVEVYTNTTSFTLNGLSEVSFDNGSGAADFYGKCKTVAVFKEALSDTELACLTTTTDQEIFFNYYYRMQYVGADMSAIGCAERTYNI